MSSSAFFGGAPAARAPLGAPPSNPFASSPSHNAVPGGPFGLDRQTNPLLRG